MQRGLRNPYIKRMHVPRKHARNIRGALAREGLVSPATSHPIPPESQLPRTCTQRYNIYKTLYHQGSASLSAQPMLLREFLARPIKTALKRLKLPTVLPGAASTLSASSASFFLCRVSDAFPSSLTLAAINLPTPSHTLCCITPQGIVWWYSSSRDAKHPTILCHACNCFYTLPPGLMEDFFVGEDVVVRCLVLLR